MNKKVTVTSSSIIAVIIALLVFLWMRGDD